MKKLLKTLPYVAIALLVGITAVYASSTTSLTPTGPAERTMYTLTDIWNLKSGTILSGENTGAIETTPSEVALSGKSLSDVYTALSTEIAKLSSSVIVSGTTAFGIPGEAEIGGSGADLSNMYNGTCNNPDDPKTACNTGTPTPFLGVNGGVDDFNGYNLGGVPPVGRYASTWITCDDTTYNATTNPGGNRCNTGDLGANAKDTATGLIWSYLCHDATDDEATTGCTSWDTETDPAVLTVGAPDSSGAWWNTDTYYTWNGYSDAESTVPYAQNGVDGGGVPLTASQLCSKHAGWSLPNQKQLMMAYIDGAYGNLEPQGVERYYWSATTNANDATYAWNVGLSDGFTSYSNKYYPGYTVRCVRE